jgi:hypothetical protein
MIEWIKALFAPKPKPIEDSIYDSAARRYSGVLGEEE